MSTLTLDHPVHSQLPVDSVPLSAETIDRSLISRFLKGDKSAFVEIVALYRARIFSVSLGVIRNRADAEEITQDTFLRAHRGLINFRGDCALSAWLFRIAVNLSRNRYWYHFSRHRHNSFSLDSALTEGGTSTLADLVADAGPDPAQETITAEFSTLVERCMAQMGQPHREILALRSVRNFSYDEISRQLDVNVGTVKSRVARARNRLRLLLVQACPEFPQGAALSDWFDRARPAPSRLAA